MLENKTDLDYLVERIVNYKGQSQVAYIERYTQKWISTFLEEADAIQAVEKEFQEYGEKGLNIFSFVKTFLNMLPHTEEETLYMTITLIDLFKSICDTYTLDTYVKASDILNYIVENYLNKTSMTHTIPTRKLPEQKKFNIEPARVRDIDLVKTFLIWNLSCKDAPIIYGPVEGNIKRLNHAKIVSDSSHHGNNGIKKACFGAEIKKIFTLDYLSDHISIYNLSCILEKKIVPQFAKQQKDTMMLDFSWSESQQRVCSIFKPSVLTFKIGATLKDLALSFWEANDDFKFEKTISLVNHLPDYQTRIWYIEFLNLWITTDKTHSLHAWDLKKEAKIFSLSSPSIQSNITDVVPIEVQKLVAVSSFDKIVTIWSFDKRRVMVKLDFTAGGLHTIIWSNTYNVLITAGYESKIKVWNINPTSQDATLVGKFVGHTSMISAVEVIEKTPMLISSDDSGNIKIWDIRNLTCVQTINLRTRQAVNRIISVYEYGKIVYIGNRINVLEFEEVSIHLSQPKNEDQLWPIKADYDVSEDQLIVCTRKDVRFFDIENGRTKKIYAGLLKNEENEISSFRLMQQNKKFTLGDDRGHLNIYSTSTGEHIKSLASHENEITSLKIDYVNKLIISAGMDSNIMIQKETKSAHEAKRLIKNLHYNKEVSLMEVSIYHNLILTGSGNKLIYVWDYEHLKLLASIQTSDDSEPSNICFINGYNIMAIADTMGRVHFVNFNRREAASISFEKFGEINICDGLVQNDTLENPSQIYASRIIVDVEPNQKQQNNKNCKMFLSTNKGNIRIYNIFDVVNHKSVKPIPHANTKSNYNCLRNIQEDFITAVHNDKLPNFDLLETYESTPYTTQKVQSEISQLNSLFIKEFKAHQDILTALTVISLPNKRLLTTSLDSYMKIWTLEGDLLCSLNINHPLPITWNLDLKDPNKYRKKIFFAMKVLDTIIKTNKKTMFFDEEKKFSINKFLKRLCGVENQEIYFKEALDFQKSEFLSLREENQRKKIVVMKDEYTPRDIQFDKAKTIYRQELQGPSLRQMEVAKHFDSNKKSPYYIRDEDRFQQDKELRFQKVADEEREKQKFMEFLIGEAKTNLVKSKELNPGLKKLAQKLDQSKVNLEKPEKTKLEAILKSPKLSSILKFSKIHTSVMASPPEGLSETISPNVKNLSTTIEDPPKSLSRVKEREATPLLSNSSRITELNPQRTSTSIFRGMEIKSPKKNDFYLYARRKINLEEEKSLPSLSGSGSGMINQGSFTERYERKLQKKSFNEILTKLNEAKNKSRTGAHFFKPLKSEKILGDIPSENLKTKQVSTDRSNRTNEALISYGMFVENQRESEGFKPFAQELRDFKEYIQGSWNIALDDPGKERASLKEKIKQNAQGQGAKKNLMRSYTKNVSQDIDGAMGLTAVAYQILNQKSSDTWKTFRAKRIRDTSSDAAL